MASYKKTMYSFFQSIAVTILLAFLLRFFVFAPFVVEGESMEPNFHNAEYIIIDKVSYQLHTPTRGDVIVFHPPVAPSENYIKRIIGLPGETIAVQNGNVTINNKPLDEPYLKEQDHHTEQVNLLEPVTLKSNEYFVLGDNRAHSSDSRDWGPVPKQNIEGRTWFIAFPFNDFKSIKRPDYSPSLGLLNHSPLAAASKLVLTNQSSTL